MFTNTKKEFTARKSFESVVFEEVQGMVFDTPIENFELKIKIREPKRDYWEDLDIYTLYVLDRVHQEDNLLSHLPISLQVEINEIAKTIEENNTRVFFNLG